MEVILLADAEGGEDEVENVVGGGGSGEGVERGEGVVEVDQQHLVGDGSGCGGGGALQGGEGREDGLALAQVGDERGLLLGGGCSGGLHDGAA